MRTHLAYANHCRSISYHKEDITLTGEAVSLLAGGRMVFPDPGGRTGLAVLRELLCCAHYCRCSQRVGFDLRGDVEPEPFTSNQVSATQPLRMGGRFSRCVLRPIKPTFLFLPVPRCGPRSGHLHRGLVGGLEGLDRLGALGVLVLNTH